MLLLIDKPKGFTSHDVVSKVRKITNERRVGHGGTLDPNATGLLIVGVGREDTKKLGVITTKTNKTYLATIVLGESRETDDVEGAITAQDSDLKEISEALITKALKSMEGEQSQVPPIYSAIRIDGVKAYEHARQGTQIEMKPRQINVFKAECVEYKFPEVIVRFEVSSGTYIRSLARDLGKKLGTCAYLKDLRREKVGEYDVSDAETLEELANRLS